MALHVVVDESGNWGVGDQDQVFVIAGFISTAEKWQAFTDAWVGADIPKSVKMARAIQMASKREPKIIEQVLGIVEAQAESRVECAVHLESYRVVIKGRVDAEIDSPYFFAFHEFCRRVAATVVNVHRYAGSIDLFFDEGKLGRRAEKWYDLARCYMSAEVNAILPGQLFFRSDDDFLPLKSADLLAGLARRDHNGDVANLGSVIERINRIPSIHSPVLEEGHLSALLAAGNATPNEECLAGWKERWKWFEKTS